MPTVLNEIVNKGVKFQNSFVTTALCAPSRSSLLAAKYSHTTGVHDNGGADGGFGAFDDASTLAVWLKAAGYHTGLYGKYLNGYDTAAPYMAPGWDEWHVVQERRLLQLHAGRERRRGRVRQRRRRLLDRRAARPGGAVHPRLGRRSSRSSSTSCRRRRTGRRRRRRATPAAVQRHPAVAAAELQRGRRLRQAGVAAGDRAVGRDQAGQPRHLQPACSSSACRRSTRRSRRSCRRCATPARIRTRWSSTPPTTATRGARTAGSRSSARTRSACACRSSIRYPPLAPLPRVETGFGLNIDHGGDARRAGGRDARTPASRARAWCTSSTAPRRPGAPTSSRSTGTAPITTLAQVRGRAVEVHRVRDERERALRRDADPFELTNVVDDPGNAVAGGGPCGPSARAPTGVAGVALGRVPGALIHNATEAMTTREPAAGRPRAGRPALVAAMLVALAAAIGPRAARGQEASEPAARQGDRRFVVDVNPFTIGQAPDWLDRTHVVWHDPAGRDEDDDGEIQIYRSTLDGTEKVCLTCGLDGPNQVPVVQPHGQWILFHSWNGHDVKIGAPGFGGIGSDVWVMRRDGSQRTNLNQEHASSTTTSTPTGRPTASTSCGPRSAGTPTRAATGSRTSASRASTPRARRAATGRRARRPTRQRPLVRDAVVGARRLGLPLHRDRRHGDQSGAVLLPAAQSGPRRRASRCG